MKVFGTTPELQDIMAAVRSPLGNIRNASGGEAVTTNHRSEYGGWTLPDLVEEVGSLIKEAEQLQSRAEFEQRDFSTSENLRWKALMGKGDQPGLIMALNLLIEEKSQAMNAAKTRVAATVAKREQEFYPTTGNLKAFKGPHAARNAHDAGMWIRAAWNRQLGVRDDQAEDYVASLGWSINATMTGNNGSDGGYTVPDPLSAAFIEYRKSIGVAWALSDVRSMTSDTLTVPKLLAGPTVTYPGEATEISESEQSWGQIALVAGKRAILEKVSNELRNDSLVNLGDQITSRMAYQFALQTDNEWINGDGTSTYGRSEGVLNSIGTAGINTAPSGHDTWGELDMADFTKTMGLLPDEYAMDPAWVCSRSFYYNTMLRVAASAGGNTINNIMDGSGVARPMFLGYPVYLTDKMPTATAVSTISALFGTFSQACIMGSRTPLEIAISADRYFEQDVTAFRGISRYDINWHNVGNSSNAGAVVALKTAAS